MQSVVLQRSKGNRRGERRGKIRNSSAGVRRIIWKKKRRLIRLCLMKEQKKLHREHQGVKERRRWKVVLLMAWKHWLLLHF